MTRLPGIPRERRVIAFDIRTMASTSDYTAPPEELLHLIIRFAASVADVPLSIPSPRTTTALNLKCLIREQLPPNLSANRLLLIHAGKVVRDTAPLYTSLNIATLSGANRKNGVATRQNETSTREDDNQTTSESSKGKRPMRGEAYFQPPPPRLFIHCSIGDALTPTELATESQSARAVQAQLLATLTRRPSNPLSPTTQPSPTHPNAAASSTTVPAPRGFDRLSATGFTQPDIQSLRRTFLAQLAMDHTPETMPTGAALLALEDRWLDGTVHAETLTTDGGGGVDEDGEADQLDSMFWGNLWGFFCPLVAIVWGFREDGVWTRRRQIAVLTGVIINLVFGFARLSS